MIHRLIHITRLHSPTGILLLLFPAWWSLMLSGAIPGYSFYGLFALGAIVMRSMGCVINDIIDKNYDAKVERTKTRPLAARTLSVSVALVIVGILGLAGLMILLYLPASCFWIGLAVVPLIVIYPFSKRYTGWPQIVLGLVFNWGVWLGWAATDWQAQPLAVISLYFGCVCWTFFYDTIYAFQDRKYDRHLGLGSSAVSLNEHFRPFLAFVCSITLLFWGAAGYVVEISWSFWILWCFVAIHLSILTVRLDPNDICQCRRYFDYSVLTGCAMSCGWIAGKWPY